jgi:hypothetical protein
MGTNSFIHFYWKFILQTCHLLLKSENLPAVKINGIILPTSDKTYIEMRNIIKTITYRKDLGYDYEYLTLEGLKYVPNNVKLKSLHILYCCWTRHRIPEDWIKRMVITMGIFKKEGK